MNEEKLNLSTRKFLKQVGITAQREIEIAVRKAVEEGRLSAAELPIKVTLECPDLHLSHIVQGKLEIS
ncbi:MAG: DUF6494 family protein [Wenzhouxiangella sp.]